MATHSRHKIDRRLRVRMFIFLAIGIVMLGFILTDVLQGDLSWWLALAAIAFGALIGYLVGRAGRFRWHDTEEKVISQMDIIGIGAILVYVLLRIGSEWVLGTYLSGVALSTFTLAILGGALLGRFLGTHHSIQRVLDRPRA